MNSKDKERIENMRNRNIELNQQLKILKEQLKNNKKFDNETYYQAQDFIDEIESIRNEWKESLDKLHQYEKEYNLLIEELRESVLNLRSAGFGVPWYKRLIRKFKNNKNKKKK